MTTDIPTGIAVRGDRTHARGVIQEAGTLIDMIIALVQDPGALQEVDIRIDTTAPAQVQRTTDKGRALYRVDIGGTLLNDDMLATPAQVQETIARDRVKTAIADDRAFMIKSRPIVVGLNESRARNQATLQGRAMIDETFVRILHARMAMVMRIASRYCLWRTSQWRSYKHGSPIHLRQRKRRQTISTTNTWSKEKKTQLFTDLDLPTQVSIHQARSIVS